MEYSSAIALLLAFLLYCNAQDDEDYNEFTTQKPIRHRNRINSRVRLTSANALQNFPISQNMLPQNVLNPPDITSNTINPFENPLQSDMTSFQTPQPLDLNPANVHPIWNTPNRGIHPIIVKKRIRTTLPTTPLSETSSLMDTSLTETTLASELLGEQDITQPTNIITNEATIKRQRIKMSKLTRIPPITTTSVPEDLSTLFSNTIENYNNEVYNSTATDISTTSLLTTSSTRFPLRATRTTASKTISSRNTTSKILRTTTPRTIPLRTHFSRTTTTSIPETSFDDTNDDYYQIDNNSSDSLTTIIEPKTSSTTRFRARFTPASTTKKYLLAGRTRPILLKHNVSVTTINPTQNLIPANPVDPNHINLASGIMEQENTFTLINPSSTRSFRKSPSKSYILRSKLLSTRSIITTSKSYGRFIRKTSSFGNLHISPTASSAFEDPLIGGKMSATYSHGHYSKRTMSSITTTSRTYTRALRPLTTSSKTAVKDSQFFKLSSSIQSPELISTPTMVNPMDYSSRDAAGNTLMNQTLTSHVLKVQTEEETTDSSVEDRKPEYDY